ncbi:hypothetical protein LEN26_008316 [Aphanomyces euteiches]|nr:hypothetical protein LEN26_008316 [Aphanomyces euteiches]
MQLASTARRRHFPSGSMTPTWLQRALCILLLALAASDAAPDAAQLGRIEHHVKNPLLYVATLYTTDDSDIGGEELPRRLGSCLSLGGGREQIPIATRTNHPRFRPTVPDAFPRYNLAMITLAAPNTLAKPPRERPSLCPSTATTNWLPSTVCRRRDFIEPSLTAPPPLSTLLFLQALYGQEIKGGYGG